MAHIEARIACQFELASMHAHALRFSLRFAYILYLKAVCKAEGCVMRSSTTQRSAAIITATFFVVITLHDASKRLLRHRAAAATMSSHTQRKLKAISKASKRCAASVRAAVSARWTKVVAAHCTKGGVPGCRLLRTAYSAVRPDATGGRVRRVCAAGLRGRAGRSCCPRPAPALRWTRLACRVRRACASGMGWRSAWHRRR